MSDELEKQIKLANDNLCGCFNSLAESTLVKFAISGQEISLSAIAPKPFSFRDLFNFGAMEPEPLIPATAEIPKYPAYKDFEARCKKIGVKIEAVEQYDRPYNVREYTFDQPCLRIRLSLQDQDIHTKACQPK